MTAGDQVVMFDAQGRELAKIRGVAGDTALNRHPAYVAHSDLATGLIYLEETRWQIRHWPDPGSMALTVVGVGERGVQLFDVALVQGRPTVTAGLHLHDDEDDWTQLALVDIETFESTPVAVFGRVSEQRDPQTNITAASYAQERILVSLRRDRRSWFELLDLDGAHLEAALPYQEDNPGSLIGHGVLSPDAAAMAYLEGSTIIVWDLGAGTEIGRWPVNSDFYGVKRLDYDGTLLVVSFGDQPEPILINTPTDTITTLPAAGVATLIER